MASSSSGDGPSTAGERAQHWELVPVAATATYTSANDSALREPLQAVTKLDVVGTRKFTEEELRETGLDAAVAAVADPMSKRCGALIHVAAATKYLEMCKMLIKECSCDPIATDANGATPLNYAIQVEGSRAFIEYLIKSGDDPQKANSRGVTPLHQAGQGYCDIRECLLFKEANVDLIFQDGEVRLPITARHGYTRMAKLLLKHSTDVGADVNIDSPVTPLSVAACKGLADCIKRLLNNEADRNEPDEGQVFMRNLIHSALDLLVKEEHLTLKNLLVEKMLDLSSVRLWYLWVSRTTVTVL